MNYEFWDNCWNRDSQPFHIEKPHPFLMKYLEYFDPKAKLFIPLSGKTLDPLFLETHGIYSIALEFNPKAVEAFIKLTNTPFEKSVLQQATIYKNGNYEIWLADFFKITKNEIGQFSQVFDRAALVALPESLQKQYVRHLKSLLRQDAKIFMVVMDYPKEQMEGPPFLIGRNQLVELFPEADISELDRTSLLDNHPRWKELELTYLDEVLYLIDLSNNYENT